MRRIERTLKERARGWNGSRKFELVRSVDGEADAFTPRSRSDRI